MSMRSRKESGWIQPFRFAAYVLMLALCAALLISGCSKPEEPQQVPQQQAPSQQTPQPYNEQKMRREKRGD